jgi:hypothetical protein
MSEITVPYLSEHEGPKTDSTSSTGYQPSDEEKEDIELVEKLYSRAKKYRKRYDQKWIDYYKMFRGRQWKETRPSYRHSEVINIIFQTIQSMVPILTDSRPKLEFLPTIPAEFEISDILNKVAENDWIHNNWLMVLTEILFDDHIYGTGFGHCGYDKDANLGLGNILFESTDPLYCYPDPDARDINDSRSKFFIIAEPVAVSQLKREYPDKAEFITGDVIDLAQGDKSDINQVMFKSPVDSKLITEGVGGYDNVQRDQAIKITCYLDDDASEEEEEEEKNEDGTPAIGEDGNPKVKFVEKLKYPNGRKIVIAGNVLLESGPIEFEDGQFPYVRMINYILPREFWGMGEVEQLEGPQKTFNKIVSYALDVMTLMGNPIWKVGTNSGVDTDNLFNKPGLVVEADDISQVQREPGVQLQPFVMELLERYRQMMDGISGQTDLSRGVEPSDVTAASAIGELQQAQQTRIRLKSRNLDAFLQQFGKMYISRVFQYYSVPRIIRVTGNDNAEEYFHFHVETLDGEDGTQKRVANITSYDEMGQPVSKQVEITGDFDVRVSTGSSLPFAKEQKTNISMNLFKLGVIDDEELLKNLDYPNYEAVLQRVAQKKAMMAQQQAVAQGGAPTPQGVPPQSGS